MSGEHESQSFAAEVSRAEQAQRVRDHYERIWQKGGDGWHSAVNLAADAWEREPELLGALRDMVWLATTVGVASFERRELVKHAKGTIAEAEGRSE